MKSNKNLVGIGALLVIFPGVGIVGMILLLVVMKRLEDYYKAESIYKNALWGVIFGIIALLVITAAIPRAS